MKKMLMLISGLVLAVFLAVPVIAQTTGDGAGQPQKKAAGKAGAKKSATRKSSKHEQAKAQVDKESKKRNAVIQSEGGGNASK